ncbi:MAG: class I SAM-dependent methyltransferase [Pseudomonadota bacterium]
MTEQTFKDHFSGSSETYAHHRPRYPEALFRHIAGKTRHRHLAWDCATGNGQAARGLAAYFDEVIATDASTAQIAQAVPHPKVEFRVAPAERSGLAPASVDLVTVAQALHWFDFDAFYTEVRRVCRPGGVLAAWCYGLAVVSPAVDEIINELYAGTLGPFWPGERRHVETGYRQIPFPFAETETPDFAMQRDWQAGDMLGYLSSWSAVARYRDRFGRDPLEPVRQALVRAWGGDSVRHRVTWPLTLRIGRVD